VAVSTTYEREVSRPADRLAGRYELDTLFVALLALLAVGLADPRHAHVSAIPTLALGALATLLLFWVSGDALARELIPRSWGALWRLFTLPMGAVSSSLVLTALGLAHVPLKISLWLTLAAGVAASVFVRRRRASSITADRRGRRALAYWGATLAILFCVALIPGLRTGAATIYGNNPDAHQVVGIAVLFQHVSPTGTDVKLPIDTVPGPWRFRYPIFYPLAAVSNLAHMDPIRAFPVIAALLLAIAAFGFGAFAVRCLGAPRWSGPSVGAAVSLSVATLHLVWHPYWNQLWGFAVFPYALLFGWQALDELDARAAALFVLMLAMLGLAYPLALPYPLVIIGALAVWNWRSLKIPRSLRSRTWLTVLLGVVVLAPAVIGAAIKLAQGLKQLVSPHGGLWGGDIVHLTPIGKFVGTGGGILLAIPVLVAAVPALLALPKRYGRPFALTLIALCLLDLRFRLAKTGAYMDFKHLAFVGALIVALAACTLARLVSSGSRRWVIAGVLLALAWTGEATYRDHRETVYSGQQVTPEMFQIRDWAKRLPPGASVRVDVPPSGYQLWAVYMLGNHPVDAPHPVIFTTYASAPPGVRADYSLSLRYYLNPNPAIKKPVPAVGFAVNPPLFENNTFVLRRIAWPRKYDYYPDTSSTRLIEP
jgi:hypothetical protein